MAERSAIAKVVGLILFSLVLVAILVLTILILVNVLNEGDREEEPAGHAAGSANGNSYEGRFTDLRSSWDPNLSNPDSKTFRTQQRKYEALIQELLDKDFQDASVYVTDFSEVDQHLRVHFVITISNSSATLSAMALQLKLETGASELRHDWVTLTIRNAEQQEQVEVSQEKGWKDAAQMFLSSIDTSVDPCEDFYAFACNNFIKQQPLENISSISKFSLLDREINSKLQRLLEEFPTDGSSGPKSLRTAALFYQSCVKSQSSDYAGAQRILEILNSLGGWPILNREWNPPAEPSDRIWYLVGHLANAYGVPSLLTPTVDVDWRNVSRHLLYIEQATLTAPASIYRTSLGESILASLGHAISQTAMALANITHVSLDPELFGSDVADMVELERRLAMISVLPAQQRNQSLLYNPYTAIQAHDEWPMVNWKRYLETLVKNHSVAPEKVETFLIVQPSYQTALTDLLSTNYSTPTGIRILYNYVLWRFVAEYSQFGDPALLELMAELRRWTHPEVDALPPPPSTCVAQTRSMLPWAVGRLYVDKHFNTSERMKTGIMVSVILSAFRGQLSGLQWMDDLSKLLSLRKVNELVKNVGYPDFIMNDTLLDQYHSWINNAVEKRPDMNYLDFTLDLVYFQWDTNLKQLETVPDRTSFLMSPTVVNAWYQPSRNSITLPAAILNPPFFQSDFPMAVNYGGIGAVMGHELTHGFDDQGVQYDYNGTLNDWMVPSSKRGFSHMATCAVEQYSGYCYPILNSSHCLNGASTQGENIADNGGIKAAYQAYQAYVASNGEEPRLPGMESFTMDQIFFLSFANVWCSVMADTTMANQIITNEHSPGPSRVNGTLQNFEAFATAYRCRPGSRMAPVKHCNIW